MQQLSLERSRETKNPLGDPQPPTLTHRYRNVTEVHADATATAGLRLLFGDHAQVTQLIDQDWVWTEIPAKVALLQQQHASDSSPCCALVRELSTLNWLTVREQMIQLRVLYQQDNLSLEDLIQAITAAQLYLQYEQRRSRIGEAPVIGTM